MLQPQLRPMDFEIALNPPLVIVNKTMMPMEVYEIDDPDERRRNVRDYYAKRQSSIPPGLADCLYQLDTTEANQSHLYFKFLEFGGTPKAVGRLYKKLDQFADEANDGKN
jgi:hypothetical protein